MATDVGAARRLTNRIVHDAVFRSHVKAAGASALGVVVLITGVAFLVISARNSRVVAAYQSSPKCSSPEKALASTTCRYSGQATIVTAGRSERLMVTLTIDAFADRTFGTSFPIDHEPPAGTVEPGKTMPAEVWNGKVTRLAGLKTYDSPEEQQTGALAIGAVSLIALGLIMLYLGYTMLLDARRRSAEARTLNS